MDTDGQASAGAATVTHVAEVPARTPKLAEASQTPSIAHALMLARTAQPAPNVCSDAIFCIINSRCGATHHYLRKPYRPRAYPDVCIGTRS